MFIFTAVPVLILGKTNCDKNIKPLNLFFFMPVSVVIDIFMPPFLYCGFQ